jgi:hypothetical protein
MPEITCIDFDSFSSVFDKLNDQRIAKRKRQWRSRSPWSWLFSSNVRYRLLLSNGCLKHAVHGSMQYFRHNCPFLFVFWSA